MGETFVDWLLEQIKDVRTEKIAAWMRNGEFSTPQYQAMQAELFRRKNVVDKKRKRERIKPLT